MAETADVTQLCNIRLSLQIVKLQPKAKVQTLAIVQYNCQAQLRLNSTSTQTKAEVIYILKRIQPPTHPTRIVEKGDLSVNFNFNSNKG